MATGDNADELAAIGAAQRGTAGAVAARAATKDAVEGKVLALTGTGNASLTAFPVAHGMTPQPTSAVVSAKNALSAPAHSYSIDATNVTVNYVAAPAAGAISLTVLALR